MDHYVLGSAIFVGLFSGLLVVALRTGVVLRGRGFLVTPPPARRDTDPRAYWRRIALLGVGVAVSTIFLMLAIWRDRHGG